MSFTVGWVSGFKNRLCIFFRCVVQLYLGRWFKQWISSGQTWALLLPKTLHLEFRIGQLKTTRVYLSMYYVLISARFEQSPTKDRAFVLARRWCVKHWIKPCTPSHMHHLSDRKELNLSGTGSTSRERFLQSYLNYRNSIPSSVYIFCSGSIM